MLRIAFFAGGLSAVVAGSVLMEDEFQHLHRLSLKEAAVLLKEAWHNTNLM